ELREASAESGMTEVIREDAALKRTTHMAIAAHQDDVEIMALEGILAGFGNSEKWFTAVIVTNGAGSPRDGIYGKYTDNQMQTVRRQEQKKAAFVGEYAAVALLNHPSSNVNNSSNPAAKNDIKDIIDASRPE